MKLNMLVLLISISLLVGSVLAEGVKVANINEYDQGVKATDKASGQALWQSRLKAKRVSDEQGASFLYVEDNGAGIYGKDKKNVTWKTTSYIKIDGNNLVPYQTKQIIKDQSGSLASSLEKYYDPTNKNVLCKKNGTTSNFTYYPDTIDREMMGSVFSNYPLDQKELTLHLITHEPALYKMTVKYLGNETIENEGRKIETFKLQMIPDLGALNLLGAFVPKTYFWYEVAPQHKFVRYEGLESGLGTPYIVIEASK